MKKKNLLALVLAGTMFMGMTSSVYAAEDILAEAKAKAEEKAAEIEAAAADELSDDLYDFELSIDGEIYQFPMTYEDFLAKGWELSKNEDPEMMVESNQYAWAVMVQGENKVYVDMLNLGINAIPMNECLVAGMSIDAAYDFNAENTSVVLPKGIVLGQASLEDIKHVYGEPSDTYEGSYNTDLSYEKDWYEDWELSVDLETGVLSQIDIRNYVEPEGFDKGSVSTETPEIVTAYEAPAALDEGMLSPVVEYFGDLYQLPVPVSAFLANGWEIVNAEEGAYLAGGDFDSIDMSRENQTVYFYISNLTENAVTLENCFIEELSYGHYDPELINMTLSGNVTLGMEKDELIALAEASGYLYEEDEDSLRVYKNADTQYDQYLYFGFYDSDNPTKSSSMDLYWEAED